MTNQPPDAANDDDEALKTIATGRDQQAALRRRGSVLELIVNGVFAMDSAHTTTEVQLAHLTLARLKGAGPLRVLVGGLGLGHTAQAMLTDARVDHLTIVELDPDVAQWAADGLMPVAAQVLADERTRLVVAAVQDVVPTLAENSVDAIVLDVDNGPAFLVHGANAEVYGSSFLHECISALRGRHAVLAIWSADRSPALAASLTEVAGFVDEVILPVSRDGRDFSYAVYLAHRPPARAGADH